MAIFTIKSKSLIELKSRTFATERELQELVDENLYQIFGLEFIRREFGGQGLSIDTIAYDPEIKSPVLIEYKKDTYQSVIDQGLAYLHWLLTHRGDYLVALESKLGKRDVDWSQPRVIFIAKRFNTHQIYASGFRNAPFELYRYDLGDNVFVIEPVETPKSDVSITSVLRIKEAEEVSKTVTTYTLQDHLNKANDQIKLLFEKLQKLVFALDEKIQEKPVSWYVGYKIRYFNFCAVIFRKEKLIVHVRKQTIDDPKKLFSKVPAKWAWGKTTIWRTDVGSDKELEYVLGIIKQGYQSAPDL